jgi:hypothetical protein
MSVERLDGRFLSALTFAAEIAAAGNFNGSKNRSDCAGAQILDALAPTTPEASPVTSTEHIRLGLNNPSLHF